MTPGAHIARESLGLVTERCLEVPPECMQGGSLWPGRALERQCITRAAPRGGLGSIRLSDQHSMRGFPRRPKVALSRICDPPGLCGRWGAQGAARGAVAKKRYNLPDRRRVHHTHTPLVGAVSTCGDRCAHTRAQPGHAARRSTGRLALARALTETVQTRIKHYDHQHLTHETERCTCTGCSRRGVYRDKSKEAL